MRETVIKLGNKPILVDIAESDSQIYNGMTIYDANEKDTIKPMLFILGGRYNTLSMDGMKFSLKIFYFDSDFRLISYTEAYPNQPLEKMPINTYYMLEIPI